jgi:hypothetical protein
MNSRRNLVTVTTDDVIDTELSVMWVINIEKIPTLLSVVLAAEEDIDFFECDLFGLGDEEENE